ncbi:acyl-CoA/acyl-ACP dehydrogenase [Tsukamurella sp. 8F]|uniref:acyl-CoA dehydrogenase family protein n=1 Tax=unclassified Tsukamurella TaxID=2633480 RepID=UPI0023B8FFB0|nr:MULTISPECIES: acyl-CoA dehydrogenase family protein [unclassified Tsukamurella]MDF0532339.1 acyl-CoA/acyl-ACP dehydrogenase [Tsukamurella sp. 8J]MDF0589457.1 acyl-CoA/acyl-ACP dehydrogenase [Tsukamurella sp. 8F]
MIEWSESDIAMRDAVRGWIDKEVRPNIDRLESGELPPYDLIRKMFADFGIDAMASEAVQKRLAKERRRHEHPEPAGESGTKREKKGGGLDGIDSMAAVLVSEFAGVTLGTVASVGVSLGLGAATIASKGTLEQKERWLPKLITCEHIASWAITEPDSGSDAFGGMRTTVRRDGDGFILKGQKTFITNGPHADVIVVYAKLDEGDGTPIRDRQVLTFVLDKGMDGLRQGPAFKKMGMMSSPTGELFFDDVRVGMDRLLGGPEALDRSSRTGDGRESARSSFVMERVGCAILALGIINECHRLCIDYAKNRRLWGRPIAEFQLVQLKLAKMEVARLNTQNMVFSALEHLRAGKLPTLAEASAMKLYSTEASTDVAMEAVQLFGGNGYMTEYRVEQLARDAKSLMIYAGSNEIQVTHVAKGLLAE